MNKNVVTVVTTDNMADEGNARGSFDSTTPTKDASSSASSESRSTADAVDIMLRCAADDARAAGARETRRETDGRAISDPGLPHLPYLTDTHARGSLVGPDSGLCAPRAHENIPTSPLGSVWLAAGDVCAVAAADGNVEFLRFARANGCPWDGNTLAAAARAASIPALRFALDARCPRTRLNAPAVDVCAEAASGGVRDGASLRALRYLVEHRREPIETEDVVVRAAGGGDLATFRYALDATLRRLVTAAALAAAGVAAAGSGKTETLRFLRDALGVAFEAASCEGAARGGHLHALRWLREVALAPWDARATDAAAATGAVETLRYAVAGGCDVSEDAAKSATRGGHLDALMVLFFFREIDPRRSETSGYADYARVWEFDREAASLCAAVNGRAEVFEWGTRSGNFAPHPLAGAAAARLGHLDVLRFVKEDGRGWDELLWVAAGERAKALGDVGVLLWLSREGVRVSPPAPAPAPALHVFPPLAPEWDAALDPDLWDKARAVLADDPPITLTHDAIY